MPADAPALNPRPMRVTRNNPFASTSLNPLSSTDSLTLVPVPGDIIETHEARKPRRSYLAPGGGGGGIDLSDLFRGMKGKRPPQHERAEPDDDDDDQHSSVPAVPLSGPPRYGRR